MLCRMWKPAWDPAAGGQSIDGLALMADESEQVQARIARGLGHADVGAGGRQGSLGYGKIGASAQHLQRQ